MAAGPGRQNLEELDRNFLAVKPEGDMCWYDIRRFGLEGKGWTETDHFYDRLPAKARGVVRPPVWELSHHCAGMCVRFVTDATRISARWTVRFENLAMYHMPATGVSGLDLYVKSGGKWVWIGIGGPHESPTNTAELVGGIRPARRQYMLYLPLYNGVESVEIGVPRGAVVSSAPPRRGRATRAICFYGTSLTQGGCASRPGMVYTSILGRWLDRPTINLGFSGNGQAEPEVADLLAELAPSVYVLDCLPNIASPNLVLERMVPMVRKLRAARSATPVIMIENLRYQQPPFVRDQYLAWTNKNAALAKVYRQLKADGIRGLYYLKADNLYGHDGEATVDGTHATDLGFLRYAQALLPVLRKLV